MCVCVCVQRMRRTHVDVSTSVVQSGQRGISGGQVCLIGPASGVKLGSFLSALS